MRKLLLTTALAGLCFVSPAFAADKDERIETLENQVRYLMKEIEQLKAERVTEKAQRADAAAVRMEQQEAAALLKVDSADVASIEPAAGEEDALKITMKPSPKFVYGDFSFQPFGRIHLDYAWFGDDVADHPNAAEFRRVRMGMKGTVAQDFGYKVQLDFANEGVAFKDVYMNYTGFEDTEVRLGHFKPPFGMEEMTSSNYITFIERAAPTSAFATSEIIGFGGFHGQEHWSLAAGIFNDDEGVRSTDDEAWNFSGRATVAPVHDDNATLHVGASYSHRKPDQASDRFDFDAAAENSVQRLDSVSANFNRAKDADLYDIEGAFVYGPVSLQGEYYMVDVDRNAGLDSLDFQGGYGQAAWAVTGERRPYDPSSGKFGRIVPENPFNPAAGGWGAWEVAGRYSIIDVSDENVLGGEMENYTLGLNWYLNKHMRLMGNYIFVDTDNNAVTPNDDPQLLLLRGQVDF